MRWSPRLASPRTQELTAAKTIQAVAKEDILRSVDVISLHYVLSNRSHGIVGAKEMKPSALLVNASRWPVINHDISLDTLERGKSRGTALDDLMLNHYLWTALREKRIIGAETISLSSL